MAEPAASPLYPVIFFDALRIKIRVDGLERNKAVYVALARNASGEGRIWSGFCRNCIADRFRSRPLSIGGRCVLHPAAIGWENARASLPVVSPWLRPRNTIGSRTPAYRERVNGNAHRRHTPPRIFEEASLIHAENPTSPINSPDRMKGLAGAT